MNIYDRDGLQALLGVGENTAYRIMQEYGFRTGYKRKSPLRITEDGVREWAENMKKEEKHGEFVRNF